MNVRRKIYLVIALVAIAALLICIVFFGITIKISTEKNREFLDERNEEFISFISIGMNQQSTSDVYHQLLLISSTLNHLLPKESGLDSETIFENYENAIEKLSLDSMHMSLTIGGILFIYYNDEIFVSQNNDFINSYGYTPTLEILQEQAAHILENIGDGYYLKDDFTPTLEYILSIQTNCEFYRTSSEPNTAIYFMKFNRDIDEDSFIVGFLEEEPSTMFLKEAVSELVNEETDGLLSSETSFLTKALIILGISMASLIIIIVLTAYLISRKVATPIEDRIEQSEAENKMLSEMDRIKTRALSEVAHELKTPLSVISAYSEAVLQQVRQIPECDDSDHMLELIKNESNHMALTVSQILDLTRIEEGRFKLEQRNCHIDTVITNAAEMYFPMLNNRGNRLRLKVPCDLPYVFIDSTRITRVIINLLTNAIKATENNIITISAEEDCDFVKVMVSDTGCGIPEEAIPHIFERYYKLEQSGTGLGLYIVKNIVESHGGTIEVSSVVGEGTTFTFTVPVAGSVSENGIEM